MFHPEIDKARRLLRITAAGQVEPEDARYCLECLQSILEDIRPGFRLLGDLSGVTAMSTATAPYIGRMMEMCSRCGVELVLRVPPPEPRLDIGFSIMSQFHYSPNVQIIACKSVAEAERLLGEE